MLEFEVNKSDYQRAGSDANNPYRDLPAIAVIFCLVLCFGENINIANKAIPAPRQGFDQMRTVRGICLSLAQTIHSGVDAPLEVHMGVGGPESLLQFLTRN